MALGIFEHFHWETLNAKSRKMLMFPVARAQKSCSLSGIFFVADLNLFLWVGRISRISSSCYNNRYFLDRFIKLLDLS